MKTKLRRDQKCVVVKQKTAIRAGLVCSEKPGGICTADINECGNPSVCDCGINPAYEYNPASGLCDYKNGC
jgi:hypothetical protein